MMLEDVVMCCGGYQEGVICYLTYLP